MRRALLLLAFAAVPSVVAADPGELGARVVEHHGRWESGYGETFYNVVGRLKNTSGRSLAWVKLSIQALDATGKVVATTETYNESAEALTVPELDATGRDAIRARLKPIPADGEERFRGSFLKDETPAFVTYRVRVIEAPPGR